MAWMLRNSRGKSDAALTGAVASLGVVLFKVLAAGATLTWGDKTFNAGAVDGAVVGALLGATWGAYVLRRYTDAKFGEQGKGT